MLAASFFSDLVADGAACATGIGAGSAAGLAVGVFEPARAFALAGFFATDTRPLLRAGSAARAFLGRLPWADPFAEAARRVFVLAL
jgi:hypothetical protein